MDECFSLFRCSILGIPQNSFSQTEGKLWQGWDWVCLVHYSLLSWTSHQMHCPDTSPSAVGRQPSALSLIQGSFSCKELPHPRSSPSWGGHTQWMIGMVQFGLVLDGHPSSVPLWRWSGLVLVCMWLFFSPPHPASFSILPQVFLSRALLTSRKPCLGLSFPKSPSCSIFSSVRTRGHWAKSESVSCSVLPTLCDPMDCSPPGSSLSMGSSRQEYWSGLPFPSAGDLPNPGIGPGSLTYLDSLPSEPPATY